MTLSSCYTITICRALGVALGVAAAVPAVQAGGLHAGDVAIVAVNTDGDDFAWVALCDIPGRTVINFTDSSVSNGLFRWTEHLGERPPGPLQWSAPDMVRAGTVVRWNGSNAWSCGQAGGAGPELSADGDQVIVYAGCIVSNAACPAPWRGDPAGATMIYAVNLANTGWDNAKGGDPSHSFVPPGLSVTAGTAVHLDGREDACYAGPRRGTPAVLRASLANRANWRTSNTGFDPTNCPAAFEVLPEATLLSLQ